MTKPSPAVIPEADATPMVRLLTRTIRAALLLRPDALAVLNDRGSVVIRSVSDAQAATLEVDGDEIRILSGSHAGADANISVDVDRRLEVVTRDAEGHEELVATISDLLSPPLPSWGDAADDFWRLTGGDAGMPRSLVVENADDGEVLELGSGLPRYTVYGTSDVLAGLFSGADAFLAQVYAGNLKVRGTLPQLSVMAGASNKVRFHV